MKTIVHRMQISSDHMEHRVNVTNGQVIGVSWVEPVGCNRL
ncbi:MAG: hypothetical protein VST67_03555 [Nitrospirota bacterium]|nr:hypothetical protein [Nitrospirota bacterium]MEC4679757.1 hypothetical protein [Nitrospirota bacterium]